MRVLLLTHNHVVREFVGIAAEKIGASIDFVETLLDVDMGSYDTIFVDDRDALMSSSLGVVGDLDRCQSVLLYSKLNRGNELFDIHVKKPFLPSDIEQVLENIGDADDIFYSEQILNPVDIDEIKSLLECDDTPELSDETLADRIKRTKKAAACKSSRSQPSQSGMETKLLKALRDMEPKKLKKLLRGAEVTISIKFPKEIR